MKLNCKKTKNIIFNFSRNNQVSTELKIDGEVVETVGETKLLGTHITDNLSWDKNTQSIVKESNKRMIFLHKAAQFTNNLNDLKRIYIMQVRSKLEQSAVLWHFGLSDKNRTKLERVQKSALKVILGKRYTTYSDALKKLNIETLEDIRKSLCLKFAKKCLQVEKLKKLFPKNLRNHTMLKRGSEKFKVNRSLTTRYKNSAIPQMQRMLNLHEKQRQKIMKEISLPVNYGFCKSLSLRQ